MQMPGFTADYSLLALSGCQRSAAWMDGVTNINAAALPTHCGSCQRNSDSPDVCEQTCCRVERIDDEDNRNCFTHPCDCPPCAGCEPDASSPTGASVICCYPTTTPFHRGGCTKSP